jgi:hypothetical protein
LTGRLKLLLALLASLLIGAGVFLPALASWPDVKPANITLVMGGDTGFGRYVEVRTMANGGWRYPVEGIAPLFRQADIAYLNFEEPLTVNRVPCDTCMVLGSHPDSIAALTYAGIDVVSLANNHQGDYGAAGVMENIGHLNSAGIAHAGAGANYDAAHQAAIVIVKGVRFGFLSYNEVPPVDYAADDTPGTAWLTTEGMRRDIINVRDKVDVLVVLPHWGIEYTNQPTDFQIEMAHLAIDSGADVVVGNHPHWVQQYENYRGRPIFYALGNLVFDQMWSQETRQGMALELRFRDRVLEQALPHPYTIQDYCRPELLPTTDLSYGLVLARAGLKSDRLSFGPQPLHRVWLDRQFSIPVGARDGSRPMRKAIENGSGY